MKALDFRIGNCVEYKGKQYQLHIISEEYPFLNTSEFGVVEWKDLTPIPITETEIVNLGFEKKEDLVTQIFYEHSGCYICFDEGVIQFGLANEDKDIVLFHDSPLMQYIHQLQNVMLALKGVCL